jgi:hypothetical protein
MTNAFNIFLPGQDGTYHACVGENASHDFRTYSEGYLEAAEKLLADIIDDNNLGGRDILVHPILFAIRHSIELAIKYTCKYLHDNGVYTKLGALTGHSIGSLYKCFSTASELDRRLAASIENLNEFVQILDSVDPDGQDFRYPIDSNSNQTLAGKRIVNLVAVRKMHSLLKSELLKLFQLIEDIHGERSLGAYINNGGNSAVNRPDLERLSKSLPKEAGSTQADWDDAQKKWVKELKISNRIYRKAVAYIKKNHEFSANRGRCLPLNALNEKLLVSILFASKSELETTEVKSLYDSLISDMCSEVVAEINAIYSLGYIRIYSEEFEWEYKAGLREFQGLRGGSLEKTKRVSFLHFVSKMTFYEGFTKGLKMLGYGHLVLPKEPQD